jgi:hypothetical protein
MTANHHGVLIPVDLIRRILERLEFPGPSWAEHRSAVAAELRAVLPRGVMGMHTGGIVEGDGGFVGERPNEETAPPWPLPAGVDSVDGGQKK